MARTKSGYQKRKEKHEKEERVRRGRQLVRQFFNIKLINVPSFENPWQIRSEQLFMC